MALTVKIPNAYIIRKPGIPKIGFEYDVAFDPYVIELLKEAERKGTKQLAVELRLPYRPRSTGYRSQNSRLHGHCSDIAFQLRDDNGEIIYTAEEVKEAMKRLSVEEGYPTKWSPIDGEVIPAPTREASTEEAKIVLDVVQRFADEHGLWLTEYDHEGKPYKSIGGRTSAEMEAFNAKSD